MFTNLRNPNRGAAGFTLVELLVVLAIIGILAGIVVPNVTTYIRKSRIARAVSEIRNADTALAGMLSDAKRSRFKDFMNLNSNDPSFVQFRNAVGQLPKVPGESLTAGTLDAYERVQGFYNTFFYTLLRQGRDANLPYLNSDVVTKLGTSYMDIGQDPWGNQYRFWMGPIRPGTAWLRSMREGPYVYNGAAKIALDQQLPGNPPPDNLAGFPAANDLPAYIYSLGPNQLAEAYLPVQQFMRAQTFYDIPDSFVGGGDDPNNWDNEDGWEIAQQ